MKPGRNRWLIRLAILFVVGIGLFVWASREWGQSAWAVLNRSGQPIKSLKISGGGDSTTLQDVPSGGEVTARLPNNGEPPFTVEGELKDGTMIRGRFGRLPGPQGGGLPRVVILPKGQIEVNPRER